MFANSMTKFYLRTPPGQFAGLFVRCLMTFPLTWGRFRKSYFCEPMSNSDWLWVAWALAVGFCVLRVFGPKVLLAVLVVPPVFFFGALIAIDPIKDAIRWMQTEKIAWDDPQPKNIYSASLAAADAGRMYLPVATALKAIEN